MSLSKVYWEFSAALADFEKKVADAPVTTISDLQALNELKGKHSLIERIVRLKREIANLMEGPGNGSVIDAKLIELETLVEQL